MKTAIFTVLAVATLMASGCGSDNKAYSYQYDINGCDTGVQKFQSKDDYCAGLKNDSLNNGCAQSERQQEFQAKCQ